MMIAIGSELFLVVHVADNVIGVVLDQGPNLKQEVSNEVGMKVLIFEILY
jgi:hypothetical protein